ncbi:MAG: hypothetical protein WKF83_17175 [Nocardioidaceae bacterium]
MPLQTTDDQWNINGWTAWRYQPGAHVPQRWHDIVAVGQRLHAGLTTEPEPAFLHRRADRWSVGDKVAGESCPLPTAPPPSICAG